MWITEGKEAENEEIPTKIPDFIRILFSTQDLVEYVDNFKEKPKSNLEKWWISDSGANFPQKILPHPIA